MSERDDDFSVAFLKVAELANRLGASPMNRHAECWEHQIDPEWYVAVNGHAEERHTKDGNVKVPPFTAYVAFNGWPFALIDPYGGTMGRGSAANEDTFIAALDKAIQGVAHAH